MSTDSVTVNLSTSNNYTCDLNGNLLSDGTRGFDYDDENELIRVTLTNVWKSEFTYDGMMRRRILKEFIWNGASWIQTNEVHFIYDGNLVAQERASNNLPLVTYTRGNDLSGTLQGAGGIGGLLARTVNSSILVPQLSTSGHAYYHADGNGNITALINASQMIVAKYLYDPFGRKLSKYGLLADANKYRFSSKEWDQKTGLYYYLYRYYDPNLQRWLNRDPIQEKSGINLYKFLNNDSVNRIDIYGLDEMEYSGAWDTLLAFLVQPENGGLSAELTEDVLSSGLIADLTDFLHAQAMRSLKCGRQGSFADHKYISAYRPKLNSTWFWSGNWQLSYSYFCNWQCGLHTDAACKCCTCKFHCQITGLVSKHYTFFYDKGGNPGNRFVFDTLSYIAQGLLGSGDYYIDPAIFHWVRTGGISHCDR